MEDCLVYTMKQSTLCITLLFLIIVPKRLIFWLKLVHFLQLIAQIDFALYKIIFFW